MELYFAQKDNNDFSKEFDSFLLNFEEEEKRKRKKKVV